MTIYGIAIWMGAFHAVSPLSLWKPACVVEGYGMSVSLPYMLQSSARWPVMGGP